jgi:hypothetical protein
MEAKHDKKTGIQDVDEIGQINAFVSPWETSLTEMSSNVKVTE